MKKNAVFRKYFNYFTMAAICFVLGFGLTLQVKSVYRINTEVKTTETARVDELQKLLNAQKQRSADLTEQIAQLKKSNEDYKEKALESGDLTNSMNDQLSDAQKLAGLTDVTGEGVTVTMDDSDVTVKSGNDASAYIIHDVDILQVLNELRDAGAEALSINGERVLATTEVRCAGNTVSVNNNRYSTPFTIKAIGEKDKLSSALLMKDGIVDSLSQWGIKMTVETSDHIKISAYGGTPVFKYAVDASSKGGN